MVSGALIHTHSLLPNITLCSTVYPTECWSLYSFNLCATKHLVGLALIALNVWSVASQFETIGDFGWFYGDFFIDDAAVPLKLSYQVRARSPFVC